MENFDFIFALSILYHIGKVYGKNTDKAINEQIKLITLLSKKTKNFIIRARKGYKKNYEFYDSILKPLSFKRKELIEEGKRCLKRETASTIRQKFWKAFVG